MSAKASPFTCAREMGGKLVLWEDRSPEFRKAYDQFMINRLLTMDSRWLQFFDEILSHKRLPDRQHHDLIVFQVAGKGWRVSWIDYQSFYPKSDRKLIKAISLYHNIGSRDATLAAARMDEGEKKRMLALSGLEKPSK